jgi:hypothetical protein
MSVTVGKINIYFPTDYEASSYMFVLHVDQLKFYQREHENDGTEKKVIAITTAEAENEYFKSSHFEPLIITIQNFRGLVVKDADWEIIENPFLYYEKKDKTQASYISQLFEILHIYVSYEKYTQSFDIKQFETTHTRHEKDKSDKDKLEVFPTEVKIIIKLPLIVLNLSMRNICVLKTLAKLWTSQTSQIRLAQIKNSLNSGKDNAKGTTGQDGKNIPGIGQANVKTKDRLLAKTKLIDHNLVYPEKVLQKLDSLILTQVDFFTQGIVVNILCDDEKYLEPGRDAVHKNEIISIYLQTIAFWMKVKYFESTYNFAMKHMIIETHKRCKKLKVKNYINKIYDDLLHEEKIINNKSDESINKSGTGMP